MSQHPIPLSTGKFSLNISGVAAFFGGEAAIQAIKTIHLYKSRKWTGWYNAPGGLDVAKYIGTIANSRFWNTLFLVERSEVPEKVFGLDNEMGPAFTDSKNVRAINTTHVTYLMIQKLKKDLPVKYIEGQPQVVPSITVVNVTNPSRGQSLGLERSNNRSRITMITMDHNPWLVSIPISASLTACALCGYNRDWYCFAVIFLGIISNGLTCLVVGSLSLVLKVVQQAAPTYTGDGFLMDHNLNHIFILKGEEPDVKWVTQGMFGLEYIPSMTKRHQKTRWSSYTLTDVNPDPEKVSVVKSSTPKPEEHRGIGLCGLLLSIQSLLQLLLIPQGTSFGQIMFLFSSVISWMYNLYLSSFFKEEIQQDLLSQIVDVKLTSRFELGTRTAAAVFATLVLQPPSPVKPAEESPSVKLLKVFLPNETTTWQKWREHVGKHIETAVNWDQDTNREEVEKHLESLKDFAWVSEMKKPKFQSFLDEAVVAFEEYYDFLIGGPGGVSK